MANFTYDAYSKQGPKSSTAKRDFKVSFFNGLKNDGDETIVRFAYNTPRDFVLNTVHRVKGKLNDGKEAYKSISCLREGTEDISKCPLCAANEKVAIKFFVKVLEYTKDENGNIVRSAKIWERPASFARTLVSKLEELIELGMYTPDTPISNIVFKIKRRGAKGSLQTTYDITPTNPMIYKPEIYVPDFSDFEGFKEAGYAYLEKTAEEMDRFLDDGILFPRKERTDGAPAVAPTTGYTQQYAQAPVYDNTPAPAPVPQPAPAYDTAKFPVCRNFFRIFGSAKGHFCSLCR